MNKQRAVLIWVIMASVFTLIGYLSGLAWYWAILVGILMVALIVSIATGTMYWKQKKLLESAAKFNINLKSGKINPADLR